MNQEQKLPKTDRKINPDRKIRHDIFYEVSAERDRQDLKWGQQNHAPIIWCGILGEEVGEVNKASIESYFDGKDLSEYRTELVQVAAVAFAMIECLDRNNHRINRMPPSHETPQTGD